MNNTKESKFAFDGQGKESFRDRLEYLIGERSVRVAAKAWGLPVSTINNYLHKGTEPALRVVLTIAEAEQVSLEWLASGLNKDLWTTNSPAGSEGDPLKFTWGMIFDSLDRGDAEALIRLIHKEGAKGILASSNKADNLDSTLLLLPKEEKERLIALHEAKKGAPEGGELDINLNPAPSRKQAS